MRKLRDNENGFSILEVIISIAALALISSFVLEMFIVSAKINQNAEELDRAARTAANIIEQFHGGRDIETIRSDSQTGSDNEFQVSVNYRIVERQTHGSGYLAELTVFVKSTRRGIVLTEISTLKFVSGGAQ
jgi:prepilin-type N-terminal cleavage/methylation domain-containing protein